MLKHLLRLLIKPIYWPIKDKITDWQYRDRDLHRGVISDEYDETKISIFVEQEDGNLYPLDIFIDRSGRNGPEIRLYNQEARRAFLNAKE